MGRYTGPKNKLSRREGIDLFGNGGEKLARRLDQPPGVHRIAVAGRPITARCSGKNRKQNVYMACGNGSLHVSSVWHSARRV